LQCRQVVVATDGGAPCAAPCCDPIDAVRPPDDMGPEGKR
jgi:hypothetical protein